MAEKSSAEQTEEPTARKLSNARDEGQVARSVELPAAAVTIGAILVMFFMGGYWIKQMAEIFASGFKFDRKSLDNPDLMVTAFAHQLGEAFFAHCSGFIGHGRHGHFVQWRHRRLSFFFKEYASQVQQA